MKVCFETFGCRLSRAEALEEEARYIARGWEVTKSHAEAQIIVVRGCSVTARAQRDCEKTIDHLKRKYPKVRIFVTGCLPSADKTYKINAVPRSVTSAQSPDVAPIPTRTARAYLKVQDGCSGQCSFCIVPKFRGKSISVAAGELLDKAKRFIDAGYHEIVLTGCNLTQYNDNGRRFPDLLAALPEGCRYRIGSVEPGAVAQAVVDVMAERADFCRFLHIPVQSGSPIILKAMKRPYTVGDVETLVHSALTKMPNSGLGCDIIAGFPGETTIDHYATLGLLKRLPFNNAHVFPFSARPGTVAAGLPGALSREIRHGRAHEIADLTKEKRKKFARSFLGKDVEIILERENEKIGWTSEYLACEIVNKHRVTAERKDLVKVHVTDVSGDSLKAMFV